MDPNPPLRNNLSGLRSQITEDNTTMAVEICTAVPLADIQRNARIIGLVQGAGVTGMVAPALATATNAVLVGRNSPWSSTINRRDFL